MKNVRVGVCDEHSIFRLGLVALLRREPGIELTGVELSSLTRRSASQVS